VKSRIRTIIKSEKSDPLYVKSRDPDPLHIMRISATLVVEMTSLFFLDFQVLGKDRYMEAQAVAATVPAAVWTIWKRNPLSICISWAIFASIGQFTTMSSVLDPKYNKIKLNNLFSVLYEIQYHTR
jgi:hypothetical protein